jgi:transcriptional regulator with XRE-family HTH domain
MSRAKAKAGSPIDRYVGGRLRMRRKMLSMSQERLAQGLGITYQQLQKYEKGKNRVSAGKLHQSAEILQVPVAFFFEGAPAAPSQPQAKDATPAPHDYVTDFLTTIDGLALVKAFTEIKDAKLRRCIVGLVDAIGGWLSISPANQL